MPQKGWMSASGQKARTAAVATAALLCPTCFLRNRNCRLRLEVSMVSRSICAAWRQRPVVSGEWGSAEGG